MASDRVVANAIAILGEAFPNREITERTADVWTLVFAETDDDALTNAVLRLCRDPERRFFPSSGEVFAAIRADESGVDTLTILHRIARLGFYDPHRGWVYPNYETIRQELGEKIAKAYAIAGATNLWAPDATDGTSITRDIARRSFTHEIERVNKATPNQLRLPPPRTAAREVEAPRDRTPRQLKPGDKTPLAATVAKVVAEVSPEESVA